MPTPKRIQRKRSKGWKMPENTISVTRRGKWSNPFAIVKEDGVHWVKDKEDNYWGNNVDGYPKKVDAAKVAVNIFSGWIDGKLLIRQLDISELKGKNLACWCKEGDPCHADVLLELANS